MMKLLAIIVKSVNILMTRPENVNKLSVGVPMVKQFLEKSARSQMVTIVLLVILAII